MKSNNVDQTSEYNCNVCCKTFKEFVLFEGHFTFNKKCRTQCGSFMQCYICPKKFCHFAELKYHLRGHRCSSNEITISGGKSPRGYRCQVCNANCYNKAQLERHVKVHEYGKVKCGVCNIRFTKLSLVAHLRHFHQNQEKTFRAGGSSDKKGRLSDQLRGYRCHVCKANCYNNTQLERHMRCHKYGKLKCEVCHIRFTQISLLCHMRKRHPEIDPRSYRKSYPCKFCNEEFSHRASMESHLKVHYFGKLRCEICDTKFTKNGLTRHNRLVHSIPSGCKVKKPQRTGEKNQNTEKLGNEDIISYQCNICKIFYTSRDQLEQHEKCHSGSYKCEVCNLPFTKHTLWRHLKKVHPTFKKQDILKYACRLCEIECLTPYKLEEHMKVHNEIELQCESSLTNISSSTYKAIAHEDLPEERNISNTPEQVAADKHPICEQPSTSSKIPDDHGESIDEEAVEQFKVENIIRHMESDGRMLYLVKWEGLEPDDNTWEESSTLDMCPNFLYRLAMYTDKITLNCDNERLTEAYIFECYLCKKHFSTLTDLRCHKNKHSLYREWVDPSNVSFSNWTIERSRENVEISSIDVGPQSKISIAADQSENQLFEQNSDDLKRNINIDIDIDTEEYKQIDDVCINSNLGTSNEERDNSPFEANYNMEGSVPADRDLVECKHFDDTDSNSKISNKEQDNYPVEADSSTEPFKSDLVNDPILELSDDEECEEVSLSERTAAPRNEDVVDISSESEDEVEVIYDDNIDPFYCYFCEDKFYSLKDLGVHSKMCSAVNN